MKDFIALLKPYKLAFFLALIALLFSSIFNAGLTLLAEPLLDDVLSDGTTQVTSKSDELLDYKGKMESITQWLEGYGIKLPDTSGGMSPFAWAILALIVFLGEAIFDFLGTYMLGRVGINVVVGLRQGIIDKVMGLSMRFFAKVNSGDILTRLNADVMRIQGAISVKMGELCKEATRCLIYVIMAFFLDWKLSLTLILLVPMVGFPIHFFTMRIRQYSSRSQGYLSVLTSHFKEVLNGIRIVKGFQREGYESDKLAGINRSFDYFSVRELKIIALTRPIMSGIGMFVLLSFIIYGSLMIKGGHLSSGQFIVYVLAVYQLYQPIKRMARANSEIQQAVGVLPRIQEIMSWDNEILETQSPKRFSNFPKVSNIHYDQVTFTYQTENEHPPVLNGVDLHIQNGQVVALVGSSGSGKSSMVNLLPRFYDVTEGSVRIDGVDIREMSKTDLRSLFAIVTQDTLLFDDTVANNIAYGLDEVSKDAVKEAARQAFAHHFIDELEDGYETRIGENGSKLSGGQRQRISIARAILANTPILILDEATSALDTESENEVQMALDNLMKTKTTLVIAHRLSTIRSADLIVVLDKGRIVEQGDHQSLMTKGGAYRKLIEMQEEGHHAL